MGKDGDASPSCLPEPLVAYCVWRESSPAAMLLACCTQMWHIWVSPRGRDALQASRAGCKRLRVVERELAPHVSGVGAGAIPELVPLGHHP